MPESALKMSLKTTNSALRISHALFNALFLRRLLLLILSVKCIKCIIFPYIILFLRMQLVWFQELMHFLYVRLWHNGKSLKPNALLMHLAAHWLLAERYRLVHEVHHFHLTNHRFWKAGA